MTFTVSVIQQSTGPGLAFVYITNGIEVVKGVSFYDDYSATDSVYSSLSIIRFESTGEPFPMHGELVSAEELFLFTIRKELSSSHEQIVGIVACIGPEEKWISGDGPFGNHIVLSNQADQKLTSLAGYDRVDIGFRSISGLGSVVEMTADLAVSSLSIVP